MPDLSISVASPRSCTICKFQDWTRDTESSHKLTREQSIEKYEDLQRSAQLGCPGCVLLHEAWVWCIPNRESRSDEMIVFNIDGSKMWFSLYAGNVYDIDIFTVPGQPRLKHIACSSLLPPSTELQHNLPRIQSWIKACETLHAKCSQMTGFTPLRLLDLQPDSNDCIQLATVVNVRYACLSHCWGSTQSKHLTKRSNIAANEKGITLLELPKTFQDAVDITKALGIRYLWIDSFCIIQDDENDWETQASLMAAIYENAYITLAAGASDSDDGGFFVEPTDKYTKPFKFHLDVDGIDHEVYFRLAVPHPTTMWPPEAEAYPLMTRGWTLQERLLARRYLCFGRHEIVWECQEDVSCSCTITEGPFNPRDGLPKFYRCEPLKYQYSLLDDLSSDDVASLWRKLVEQHSERDLTIPGDKLPALAGLAERFQRVLDSSYLAGLWVKNLREDLTWRTGGGEAPPGRVRKCPSWTWAAARDSRIEWLPIELHRTFQVDGTSFDQEVQHFNPHSYAEGSHVHATGLIQPLSIRIHTKRNSFAEAFPLIRQCHVVEWGRRHPEHSQLLVQCHGSLADPIENELRETTQEAESHRKPPIYGEFRADYRFWETEEGLRGTTACLLPFTWH